MRATRFRKIFTFLILLGFVLIVLYYNLIFTKSNTIKDRKVLNKEEYENPIFQIDKPLNLSFDDYCDEYGEWETIGRDYYFKRESVFYFVDASFFRINYMSDVKRSFNLEIKVKIKYLNSSYEEIIKNGLKWKSSWSGKTFRFSSLDVPFNILNIKRTFKGFDNMLISLKTYMIGYFYWSKIK
ncbi:unnamed protein product [Brachionus calyciflorus]|uniref:Uncharacterized protein n=1 Tax=Brachionus calyciflorus TaxID=104777 RepID=A0A813U9D7_9BILA|nr:unnamed protein product [Brachionus calyciflorus]